MSVGSWAASGVVQPIADFWQYDEQVYLTLLKYGDFCPAFMALQTAYATEQAALRLNGMKNAIDEVLVGTGGEEMRTDDFMAFYGELAAG